MRTEFQSDSAEDVSFSAVPGSAGTHGRFELPWSPRATPASDRARAEAMAALSPVLDKFKAKRPRPLGTPVDTDAFQWARARFARSRT